MKHEKCTEKRKGCKKFKCINTNVILWRYFTVFAVGIILIVAVVCYSVLGNAFMSQQIRRVKEIGGELTEIVNDDKLPELVKISKVNEYALYDSAGSP